NASMSTWMTLRLMTQCAERADSMSECVAGVGRRNWRKSLARQPEMRRLLVAGVVLAVAATAFGGWRWCGVETVVVLARHADRLPGQKSDELAPAGVARSRELAHALEKAGVGAIIHSDTQRAAQTAAPLAAATGITPIVIPAKDLAAIAAEVRSRPGETILIVGHSNTVPPIIAALGGPELPDLRDTEFDDLAVLTLCRCGWRPARLVSLQYGALSPGE
ncbi:MAG: histidine phosphatase family protein, partial [Nevskiaceae bacterium]